MKVATEVKTPASTVSVDERKEELRNKWDDLDEQEHTETAAIAEANRSIEQATVNLTRIQEEKRQFMKELMDDESALQSPLELTPEMVNEAISALKAEFDRGADGAKEAGYIVQEGLDFAPVEAKLQANKDALASLYRMVQTGSRPAVVCEENRRYCIAETFGQTLGDRANCVYDRKAQIQVGRKNCNGNAVDQAKAMGISLMERRIADAHLTAFPDRDQYCYDYIQATEGERESGRAPFVYRNGGGAVVGCYDARAHDDDLGWRGALWF